MVAARDTRVVSTAAAACEGEDYTARLGELSRLPELDLRRVALRCVAFAVRGRRMTDDEHGAAESRGLS